MKLHSKMLVILSGLLIQPGAIADVKDEVQQAAADQVKAWMIDPVILTAIRAQNDQHGGITQDDIQILDKKWRAETKQSNQPMIKKILGSAASNFLRQTREGSRGLYTEIFVMDNKGMNVAQSDVTSDYWQGDEAKWQKTFLAGPKSSHVSDVEMDESTQVFQVQYSLPIIDPADKTVIGAVTVGINVDAL